MESLWPITKKYFAAARPDDLTRVALLVRKESVLKSGAIGGQVINGAWAGRFTQNEAVPVTFPKNATPIHIVWQGDTYKGRDYNAAIAWIEDQIREQAAPE